MIQISLFFSAVFSILFGLSHNFFVALAMRFMMGCFSNIDSIIKTLVSELAGNDRDLEAKAMNNIVSFYAIASLLAPAIGGALSDPVKQHSDVFVKYLQDTPLIPFLTTYRYILPNIVGAVLCLIGYVITRVHLTETLSSLSNNNLPILDEENHKTVASLKVPYETDTLLVSEKKHPRMSLVGSSYLEESFAMLSLEAFDFEFEDDINDAIRTSYILSDDLEGVITSDATRKSRASSIVRRSTLRPKAVIKRFSKKPKFAKISERSNEDDDSRELDNVDDVDRGAPTTMTFLKDVDIRNHLLIYCIGCFVMAFHMEAFPLFCLSKDAGLGVSEDTIGSIMLTSGIIHALLQPSIYGYIFASVGLRGSIKWATTCLVPLFFLVPFALLSKDVGQDRLQWKALIFLGVVVGLGRIFTVTFHSSMSVSMNHLVAPECRATFNGLLTRIAGGCKGAAPIMAGFFVSWVFSSGIVPAHGWGAVVLYGSLGIAGILLSAATVFLLGDKFL